LGLAPHSQTDLGRIALALLLEGFGGQFAVFVLLGQQGQRFYVLDCQLKTELPA
jgi:hypothetical protein